MVLISGSFFVDFRKLYHLCRLLYVAVGGKSNFELQEAEFFDCGDDAGLLDAVSVDLSC